MRTKNTCHNKILLPPEELRTEPCDRTGPELPEDLYEKHLTSLILLRLHMLLPFQILVAMKASAGVRKTCQTS
eukprot:5920137-Karenia_brevis.AAC.1